MSLWPSGVWSDAGCSGHHLKEAGGSPSDYRIGGGPLVGGYTAEKEVKKVCEHEGCDYSETTWRRIKSRVEVDASAEHERTRSYGVGPRSRSREPEKVRTGVFRRERKAREVLAEAVQNDG